MDSSFTFYQAFQSNISAMLPPQFDALLASNPTINLEESYIACKNTYLKCVETPLGSAIKAGNLALVKHLASLGVSLNKPCIQEKHRDSEFWSKYQYVYYALGACLCCKDQQIKQQMLEFFIEKGIDLNQYTYSYIESNQGSSEHSHSILYLAASQKEKNVVKLLLQKGANLNNERYYSKQHLKKTIMPFLPETFKAHFMMFKRLELLSEDVKNVILKKTYRLFVTDFFRIGF